MLGWIRRCLCLIKRYHEKDILHKLWCRDSYYDDIIFHCQCHTFLFTIKWKYSLLLNIKNETKDTKSFNLSVLSKQSVIHSAHPHMLIEIIIMIMIIKHPHTHTEPMTHTIRIRIRPRVCKTNIVFVQPRHPQMCAAVSPPSLTVVGRSTSPIRFIDPITLVAYVVVVTHTAIYNMRSTYSTHWISSKCVCGNKTTSSCIYSIWAHIWRW